MPVYNYVVVIDDALMKITHVIRGDDHLSNTPKQVALYEALGWPVPEFAHLSTILGSDRERLSKRHGATSIASFREMGVLPEALVNYLVLLGWAPPGGTREIFSSQELVKEFSLERVTPSAAVFDMEKLYWLNRHYIKSWPVGRLTALGAWFLSKAGYIEIKDGKWLSAQSTPEVKLEPDIESWLARVVELVAPSVDRLDQLPERAALNFTYDAKAAMVAPDNAEVLAWPNTDAVLTRFTVKILEDESAKAGKLTPECFKLLVNEVKAETGAKGKELFHPIRIVITGSHSGPEFDKLIPILEDGSRLKLPKHVLSVRERVEDFGRARAHKS
jgi:glutamyl-tRNA synthetase/nondiscriminating glutamyl-tRNA synthetase